MIKLAEMYITLLPVILAGIMNMVWCKIKFCDFLRKPVDFGKNFTDGRRIFGDNKTFKGFAGMIVFGTVFTVLWGLVSRPGTFAAEHTLVDFGAEGVGLAAFHHQLDAPDVEVGEIARAASGCAAAAREAHQKARLVLQKVLDEFAVKMVVLYRASLQCRKSEVHSL